VFRAKHFENFNATKRLNSMIEKLKRLWKSWKFFVLS
jgi:hypothetical protein